MDMMPKRYNHVRVFVQAATSTADLDEAAIRLSSDISDWVQKSRVQLTMVSPPQIYPVQGDQPGGHILSVSVMYLPAVQEFQDEPREIPAAVVRSQPLPAAAAE